MANVGKVDRGLRLIVGFVLMLLPFVTSFGATSPMWYWGILIVGVVLALTSIFKFCPAYRFFGVNICTR